jgi:hypothetical protein
MWLNNDPRGRVMVKGVQVAEVVVSGGRKLIRNKRPNGTVGVCFDSEDWKEIRSWLDHNMDGWRFDI